MLKLVLGLIVEDPRHTPFDTDTPAGDIEQAILVAANRRFRGPQVSLKTGLEVDPQPVARRHRRVLGGGRRGGCREEQNREKSRHMRVNAADRRFERGVQKDGLCVNWCMDNAAAIETTVDNKTKKKDKVRSAWISFAGRIVAQLVGAIATVALGVMVLHRYTSSTDARPPAAQVEQDRHGQPAASAAQTGPVHVIVLTPAMLGLRDADPRLWPAERSCTPAVEGPSTAHLDNGTFLSR